MVNPLRLKNCRRRIEVNRSNDRHSLPRYLAGRNGASYLVRGYTTRAGRILSLIYDISLEFRSIPFVYSESYLYDGRFFIICEEYKSRLTKSRGLIGSRAKEKRERAIQLRHVCRKLMRR